MAVTTHRAGGPVVLAGPLIPASNKAGAPGLWFTLGAASLVIAGLLWLHGGAADDLRIGLASAATSLGRLAGLIAADLLLIQVMLMARVPAIERSFGQDQLARTHRLVGFTSINLMLLHILLVTVGYAGSDRHPVLSEAWRLITAYPGMLLAAAATVALLMVAVTSIRAARARLRYESWHLLHLYAYLGVGLSIPHELWTGADFVSSPLARLYWWTVYLVAAGCIVGFRLGLPLYRSLRHDLRVWAVRPEGPGVWSVYLSGRQLDRLPVRAGQFLHWRFLSGRGWTRANPYSLSAAPRSNLLRITVKDLGDGSRSVATLRPGTRVLMEGPYGRLTGAVRTAGPMTLIASGIGITPLRALVEAEAYRHGEAVLLYRVRRPVDAVFQHELAELARARGLRVRYLVGPRGPHHSWLPAGFGYPAAELRALVPWIAASDVYLCGPADWMAAVARSASECGVPDDRIHMEQFAW
jgi:predicted ferric reductase